MRIRRLLLLIPISLGFFLPNAWGDITIGAILSLTGPAASLGIPEQRTLDLLPKQIAGQNIRYIILDDRSDPTEAVKDAKKLIEDDHVAAIIGASTTPSSLAMVDVIGASQVPMITLASGYNIAFPVRSAREWVFMPVQTTALMARSTAQYMADRSIKKVAFIGFDNALGEDWWKNFSAEAKTMGISIVANERFDPAATSVTGQVLHLLAAKPQAVLIAAFGTAAALPQRALKQVGFKGQIYQTHGVANPDFLRLCGADCNGTILSLSPGIVASQLPAGAEIKPAAMRFAQTYENAYGPDSLNQFSTAAWDAGLFLQYAIPLALKTAQPMQSSAFRTALRDNMAGIRNLPGSQGIYNMTPTDHNGLDGRAVAVAKIEKGRWILVKYPN
jgi:branched-chain amino acid transport system substrate-binding protein